MPIAYWPLKVLHGSRKSSQETELTQPGLGGSGANVNSVNRMLLIWKYQTISQIPQIDACLYLGLSPIKGYPENESESIHLLWFNSFYHSSFHLDRQRPSAAVCCCLARPPTQFIIRTSKSAANFQRHIAPQRMAT